MKLFSKPNAELEAELAQTKAELEAAQTKAARADELERDIAELRAGFDTERAEFVSKLELANESIAKLESEKAELTKAAEFTQEKVQLQASRLLASHGHAPIEEATADTRTHAEIYRELQSTNPAKAGAYWNQHKEAIIKGK